MKREGAYWLRNDLDGQEFGVGGVTYLAELLSVDRGRLTVGLGNGVTLFATPDWDGVNQLPIEIVTEDGATLYKRLAETMWSAAVDDQEEGADANREMWINEVTRAIEWYQEYEAAARRV